MKVVIIDDEMAMHLIMKRMLGKIDGVDIVGSFQTTKMAFAYLQDNEVDLAFVDISMPWESGLDFARRLREGGWQMKLVFVTSHKEYALPAFDVYAYDYIVKPISQERLRATVQRILSEKIEGEEEHGKTVNQKAIPSLIESLTKREKEVLQFISNGMSNREIAAELELTEGTVKNHIVSIFGKLQVKNRVQAVVIAKQHQLIN